MSDSTSLKTSSPDLLSDTVAPTLWRQGATAGWIFSLLLHGTAYTALFLITSRLPAPAAMLLGPDTTSTQSSDGDAAREKAQAQAAAKRERSETDTLRRQVGQLVTMRDQLHKIRDAKEKQLGQSAQKIAQNAPRDVKSALQQAAKAQEIARQAQAEAAKGQEKLSAARAKIPQSADAKNFAQVIKAQQETAKAQERAVAAQKQAVAAQQAAARSSEFAGQPFAPVKVALDEAARKQNEAQDAQRQANEKLAKLQERAAEERTTQWKAQQARQKLAAAQKQEQQSNAHAEAAERTREAARIAAEDAQHRNAEPQRQSAEATAQKARQEAEARRREADAARQEAQCAQGELNREEGAALDRSQAADAAQKEAADAQKQAAQKQAEAQGAQSQAAQSAMQASAAAAKASASAGAGQDESRSASTRNSTNSAKTSANLNGKNIAELYDVATTTEKEISEFDRQVRAANLAAVAKVPYSEALSQTDAAAPLRQPLDREALNGQSGDAAARRAQMAQAQAEIRSMLSSGQRMLARAGGTPGSASGKRSAAQGKDSKGGPASSRSQQTGPVAAVGSAIDPARDARMMSLAQQASGEPKDLTRAMKSIAPGGGGPSDLERPWLGKAGPEPVGAYQAPEVVSEAILKKSIPGRRVTSKGQGAEWMFVNSWYTIGPFPNEGRSNLHRRFAPESVVDLDATYGGKDNRPVRWEFVQTATPMLRPAQPAEYAVYYAYTELWFDEPRDLWVAIGSDDASTIWVEGQMVWKSRDDLKAWSAGEGLRRIHFKKGLNRVLYRLENGWGEIGLSFVIQLKS